MYSSQTPQYPPSMVGGNSATYNTCEASSGESGSTGDSDSNQNGPNATNTNLSPMNTRLLFTPYVSFRELYNAKKPYQCDVCRKRFKLKVYLKKHEMAPELGKHFSCVFCSKAFPERDKLRVHERIHTGEKPFECHVCPMAFARKDKLKNHARSHTGEKPFVCGICLKSFARNDKLVMHQRTHSGERPFECNVCAKAFSRRDHLKKHMRVHNSDGEPNHRSHVPNKNPNNLILSNYQCSNNNNNNDFKTEYVPRMPHIPKPEPGCYLTPAHDLLKAISAGTTMVTMQNQPAANSSSVASQQAVITSSNSVTPLRQPHLSNAHMPTLLDSSQQRPTNHGQQQQQPQQQQQHTPTSMSISDANTQILSQPNQSWKRNPISSNWTTGWANPLSVPTYPVQRKPENQQPLHNIQTLMQ